MATDAGKKDAGGGAVFLGVDTAKTHLQHVLTAVAMKVVRLLAWFAGEPKARTRVPAFAGLAPGDC